MALVVVKRYVSKTSGSLLDRIDLHVEVMLVSYDEITTIERPKVTSAEICGRVLRARAFDRIIKVAHTAADLTGSPDIRIEERYTTGVWTGKGGRGEGSPAA